MSYLEWPNAKDPDSARGYTVTWEDLRSGEVITASVWIVPAELTGTLESFTDDVTHIKLAGGVSGETYELINTITTNQVNEISRTIRLKVKDR